MRAVVREKRGGVPTSAGAILAMAGGVVTTAARPGRVEAVSVEGWRVLDRLKNDPAAQEEIEVVQGRIGNGPAIVLARRVSGPHGEFRGLVSRATAPAQRRRHRPDRHR